MQRWGEDEGHQYVLGAYSDLADAMFEGLIHSDYRAGKYEPKIVETIVANSNGKHHPVIKVSRETALNFAKLKYPEKFDDKGQLKEI